MVVPGCLYAHGHFFPTNPLPSSLVLHSLLWSLLCCLGDRSNTLKDKTGKADFLYFNPKLIFSSYNLQNMQEKDIFAC